MVRVKQDPTCCVLDGHHRWLTGGLTYCVYSLLAIASTLLGPSEQGHGPRRNRRRAHPALCTISDLSRRGILLSTTRFF
jgi:hypothetical protein